MCHTEKEKREKLIAEGIEQTNQEILRTVGEREEKNEYVGIMEADRINQEKMNEKIQRELLWRKDERGLSRIEDCVHISIQRLH